MANFFARVELLGSPSPEDYERLTAAMKVAGFVQTAVEGKKTFQMPQGFYAHQYSTQTLAETGESVREAAASVQSKFLFVTVEANAWAGWVKAV